MLYNIKIQFNADRLNKKLSTAQKELINRIKDDTKQYVPAKTLKLQESTIIRNKNQELVYRTPYARYQYIGFVRTDESGRTFVGKGEKKPILTGRRLRYNKSIHPKATSRWFEVSKNAHIIQWAQLERI